MNESNTIISHYEKVWGAKCEPAIWKLGPVWQMPAGFQICVYPPSTRREMWTYATCGMSQQGDATPLELHLFSPTQTDGHVELLTVIAHYHLTGDYLDVGHTVNFGRPWLAGSICDHGLISLPYLDGPELERLATNTCQIRFLWLIPITLAEVRFAKMNGLEALGKRFEEGSLNYLDPMRPNMVR